MANGRMLQRKITKNRQINELSSDTCRLAYTWMIPFIDKEGRTHGDPAIVKATVFPRRDDVTTAEMAAYIQEWHDAGLVVIYQSNGDQYLYFLGFDASQPGLRKDREPDSELPAPPAELIRQTAGCLPDDCRMIDGKLPDDFRQNAGLIKEKLIKENQIEVNLKDDEVGILIPLARAFTQSTGLPEGTGGLRWLEGLDKLHALGATPEDVTAAVDRMNEINYTIASPLSLVNTCAGIIAKRKGKGGKPVKEYKTDDPDYVMLEYADGTRERVKKDA